MCTPRTHITSDMCIPFQYGCRVFDPQVPSLDTQIPSNMSIPFTCEISREALKIWTPQNVETFSNILKALGTEDENSTVVKRPRRFSFYLVGFYLILSGNLGKDV